jgi:hypothetical protein
VLSPFIVSALVAASDHKNTRIYQANLSAGLDEQRGLAEYVPRLVIRLPRFLWSLDTRTRECAEIEMRAEWLAESFVGWV